MSRTPIHDHSNIHQGGKIRASASITGVDFTSSGSSTGGGSGSSSGTSTAEDLSYATVTAAGATSTVDCQTARVHHLVLNANCVLTLSGPVAGETHRLTLLLQQDATGSRIVTWPASVYWPGAVTPTLATNAGYTDWVDLITVDGGTSWFGVLNAAAYHTTAASTGAYWPMLALTSA